MRLEFPVSTLSTLRAKLRQNPEATGVVVTQDELIDLVDELLANGDSNAVLLGAKPRRMFMIDNRTIHVSVEAAITKGDE